MAIYDCKDHELVIGLPDDDPIAVTPIYGDKQDDFRIKMLRAFMNAK